MLVAGLGATTAASSATPASASSAPVLTSIRAAHHPGFDRLVFLFRGRVPAHRSATYVKHVRPRWFRSPGADQGQGQTARAVLFHQRDMSTGTTLPNLPGIIQVVNAGDFEAVLTFGVGVSRHAPFHMFKLTNPSRVVINI